MPISLKNPVIFLIVRILFLFPERIPVFYSPVEFILLCHHPQYIVFAGRPVIYKSVVIFASGVTTLPARIDAISFRFLCEMHHHPPARPMIIFRSIDDMRSAAGGKSHSAEGTDPQQMPDACSFIGAPGKPAFCV